MKKKVYERPTITALALEPQRILSGSGGGSGGSSSEEEVQSDQFAPIISNSLDELESSGQESGWSPVHYW